MPALERLLHGWPAIKHYFLLKGENECRKEIWDFVSKNLTSFDNNEGVDECYSEGISEVYLYFVHNVMLEFQTAILALENDGCTVLEIDGIMRKLLNQLKSRLQDKFYGSKNRSILTKLPNAEKEIFNEEAEQFFQRAIRYLEERFDFSEESLYKMLSKFSLKKETLFTWSEILELIEKLKILNDIDTDHLYSDYCSLKEVFSLNRLPEEKTKMTNDKLWAYFIRNCVEVKNLTKIVCFIFSIPVSNAYCERVFSILNNLYSKERNRMSMDLIKAELIIRLNFDENCLNFKTFLNSDKAQKLLNAVKKNDKYLWQEQKQ